MNMMVREQLFWGCEYKDIIIVPIQSVGVENHARYYIPVFFRD